MSRRGLPLLAAALAVLVALPAAAGAQSKRNKTYLSLGDSLSVGYQKKADGSVVLSQTGYSENVAQKAGKTYPGLRLRKLGCPGENTTTFQKCGSKNCRAYKGGSQLAEAVRYLRRNRSKVAFVTVSVGANNFTPCATADGVDIACIASGQVRLEKDLPKIYRALRRAAGKKIQFAVLAPYNPFLAFYLKGSESYGLAQLSISLAKQIRDTIAGAARKEKFRVADAYRAFETERYTEMVPLPGVGSVPYSVARICQLTFMCAPPPQGPDIHPNDDGYGLLGVEFARALRLK
jgi:lysophospholipase L1-like esterase